MTDQAIARDNRSPGLASRTPGRVSTRYLAPRPASSCAAARMVARLRPCDCHSGEARNGRETLHLLRTIRPDLLFLDVQMPELDGFDVLAALGDVPMPAVIFV